MKKIRGRASLSLAMLILSACVSKPASELTTSDGPAVVRSEAAQALDQFVEELTRSGKFSGQVLVGEHGKVLFERAYGLARRDPPVAVGPTTQFNIASIGKMFTAVLILQMVEEGRLSLDDSVGELLPGALPDTLGRKVLIKHLLTHTSGLGDFTQTTFLDRNEDDWRDDLEHLRSATLESEPGSTFAYSNAGYLLLGAVFEKVSGENFHDALRTRIYQPSGMRRTVELNVRKLPPDAAIAYTEVKTGDTIQLVNAYDIRGGRGGPAGGNFSTASDLHLFASALMGGRLLRPQKVREMLSAKPELGSARYGYGGQVWEDGSTVGHSGGAEGMNNQLRIRPASRVIFVVLSNTDEGARPVVPKAMELL